tara:strand:+ start:174 stop:347 length:174 start_codon:yes stop_codon:yes gene_type:complete
LKIKGTSVDGLSKDVIKKLKRHAVHHTASHIKVMIYHLKKGVGFDTAHQSAMDDVGY